MHRLFTFKTHARKTVTTDTLHPSVFSLFFASWLPHALQTWTDGQTKTLRWRGTTDGTREGSDLFSWRPSRCDVRKPSATFVPLHRCKIWTSFVYHRATKSVAGHLGTFCQMRSNYSSVLRCHAAVDYLKAGEDGPESAEARSRETRNRWTLLSVIFLNWSIFSHCGYYSTVARKWNSMDSSQKKSY